MEMLGLVLFVLVGGVSLISMLAALHLLLPTAVERARLKLAGSLSKAFLLGLVYLLFFGALGFILFWLGRQVGSLLAGILAFLALLIAVALEISALNGLAALASLLGERIGEAKNPFLSDLRGGLLLVLACLTPYIGWYIFTPFVLCVGLGASVLALFQRKPASPPAA